MKRYGLFLIISIFIVSLIGCAQPAPAPGPAPTPEPTPAPAPAPAAAPAPEEEYEIKTTPDGTRYIVHPEKILSGGPPKDGIPSIDNPQFVSVEEADQWIEDNELVITIDYKGVKRVYPLQILVWHEIVNDTIAGDPILITY